MKQTTIILFPVLLFLSCITNDKNAINQNSNIKILSKQADTSDLYYQDLAVWQRWLNLSDIKKNSSDLELRLWICPELLTKKKMVSIRDSAGFWKATLYSFDIRNGKLESSKDLTPSSNWENIKNQFLGFKIGQLPDDSNVPATLLYDDGNTFIIEIADKKAYRFSKFSNPQPIRKQNQEADHWSTVIDFIFQEFGVTY